MATIVNIPGHGDVEFPDSMSQADIEAAARRLHGGASKAQESAPEAPAAPTSRIEALAREMEPITKNALPRAIALTIPSVLGMGAIGGGALGGGLEALASRKKGESLSDTATNVGIGTAGGAAVGVLTKALGALIKGALARADRMSLRTLKPTAGELEALEKDFGSWEEAGKVVRESGAAKPGFNMRDRRDVVRAIGKEGSAAMSKDLQAAKALGATPDPVRVGMKLDQAKADLFPAGAETTEEFASAAGKAARHADRVVAKLANNPDVQVVENAKKAARASGFLNAGKYADPRASQKDPLSAYFRRATGVLKEETETAMREVDPALAEKFIADKARSAIGQAFEPIATRAANVAEATGKSLVPETAWSLRSALTHSVYDPVMSHVRPYLIPVNIGMSKLNVMPQLGRQLIPSFGGAAMSVPGVSSDIDELVRLLREREKKNAP